jgi:DNA (cytosine-5)-methyltransferase 1
MLTIFPKFKERKKEALKISKWHNPPHHVKRQIIAMMHTPTGQSAFNNNIHKPIKENGELVKGFPNTYKRQNWDAPAYTITMDNVKISSQNNVHPGRQIKKDDGSLVYSDPRTLTLFEIMKLMSLPEDWNIPANTSEAFLRRVIGEGIPPLLVKYIFENLK